MLDQIPQLLAFLLFIFGFGFLIFIHELGHFLVAKWAGVHCTQFAIGFGQAILSYRKGMGVKFGSTEPRYFERVESNLEAKGVEPTRKVRMKENGEIKDVMEYAPNQIADAAKDLGYGETEYRLNWIPLGGYVKMVGQEDLDPTATSDDPRAFNQQPFLPRAAIISAGVTMNAIFAVIFFIIAFMAGVEFPPAKVGPVSPDSPAATTPAEGNPDIVGLQYGDDVIEINGKRPNDFTDIQIAPALAGPDDHVDMVVRRPGIGDRPERELRFHIKPQPLSQMDNIRGIGIAPPTDIRLLNERTLANPALESTRKTYEKHGLKPGMVLAEVDGHPVSAFWQYKYYTDRSAGAPMTLRFAADPEAHPDSPPQPITVTVAPESTDMMGGGDKPSHLLGIAPMITAKNVVVGNPADGVIEPGDLFVKAGHISYPSSEQLIEVISGSQDMPVEFDVLRNGERKGLTVRPSGGKIGVILEPATSLHIRTVLDGSPFASLNIAPGSKLTAINGQPVADFREMRLAIQNDEDRTFDATFHIPIGDGAVETHAVTLSGEQATELASLGWSEPLHAGLFRQLQQPVKANDVVQATTMGLEKTGDFMIQTYLTLKGLFQQTVPLEAMRGPVGITQVGVQVTERGIPWLMYFLGLISINLAVINFLPLPIVDGGLFVLLCIEKLRGRPVSPQMQQAITLAGLVLLGTLFLVITFYDIQRLAS